MESLLALTEEHNLKTYTDLGQVYANWARGKQRDPVAGAVGLKQALASYLALGNKSGAPSFHGLLAELEALRPDLDRALTTIDAGLANAEETGEHYTDPYLHRLRGEFLRIRSPGVADPAEEAFQTAIAIAKGQGARGYALLASHSLAKYQSTNASGRRQAILAPALEGFPRRQEMRTDRTGAGNIGSLAASPPVGRAPPPVAFPAGRDPNILCCNAFDGV